MKLNKGPRRSGPSSSIGILNFFDTDVGGPQLSPEFVLILTAAFIVLMLVLHIVS